MKVFLFDDMMKIILFDDMMKVSFLCSTFSIFCCLGFFVEGKKVDFTADFEVLLSNHY